MSDLSELYAGDCLCDEPVPTLVQVGAVLGGAVIAAALIACALRRFVWAD